MENTLSVAKALFSMYVKMFDVQIDEMKMHKLMYFTQRESLIVNNDVLFSEDFYGWRYGPVLLSVRNEFQTETFFRDVDDSVSETTKVLIKNVLGRFGNISSWNLSIMSHEELSWKLSRNGLEASDNGNVRLSISAMKLDAIREVCRRKMENTSFA